MMAAVELMMVELMLYIVDIRMIRSGEIKREGTEEKVYLTSMQKEVRSNLQEWCRRSEAAGVAKILNGLTDKQQMCTKEQSLECTAEVNIKACRDLYLTELPGTSAAIPLSSLFAINFKRRADKRICADELKRSVLEIELFYYLKQYSTDEQHCSIQNKDRMIFPQKKCKNRSRCVFIAVLI